MAKQSIVPRNKTVVLKKPLRTSSQRNKGGREAILSPGNLNKLAMEYQVFEMRKAGNTYEQIADALGVSSACVNEHLKKVLQTVAGNQETIEEVRTIEATRLDNMFKTCFELAEAGSLAHMDMALKIMARRAKMLGSDAPEQKEIEISGIREYVGIDINLV